ncbi:MAG: Tfp pilus assembly protein FimT/FimU [Chthoniobacteraceae bacterium]
MKAQSPNHKQAGFSLLEILIVMAIVALIMGFLVPALMRKSSNFTASVYKIEALLETARTYAVANNTFVWVGFTELNDTTDYSPGALISGTGTGRIVVTIIASRNGTRGYDVTTSPLNSPACWASYSGTNFIAVGKLQYFSNLHLASLGVPPTSGNMARYDTTVAVGSHKYNLGDSTCVSVTPFAWPLGTTSYNFYKVINFDPQGVARIQYNDNKDTIVPYIEIGLTPIVGNHAQTTGSNQAAIQIDCMTGATRIYRP